MNAPRRPSRPAADARSASHRSEVTTRTCAGFGSERSRRTISSSAASRLGFGAWTTSITVERIGGEAGARTRPSRPRPPPRPSARARRRASASRRRGPATSRPGGCRSRSSRRRASASVGLRRAPRARLRSDWRRLASSRRRREASVGPRRATRALRPRAPPSAAAAAARARARGCAPGCARPGRPRLPARPRARAPAASARRSAPPTRRRRTTASIRDAVTFACWPPGPEERDARTSISRSGIAAWRPIGIGSSMSLKCVLFVMLAAWTWCPRGVRCYRAAP